MLSNALNKGRIGSLIPRPIYHHHGIDGLHQHYQD